MTTNTTSLPTMMTREEVAVNLQLSTRSIDKLWRKGQLPRPSRIGTAIRFSRSEVMNFIEAARA